MTKSEQQALAALAVVGVAAAYVLLRRDAKPDDTDRGSPILGTGGALFSIEREPGAVADEPGIMEVVSSWFSALTGGGEATTPDPDSPKTPTQWRMELRPLFRKLEMSYAMPTGFLEAIADRESRFRHDIISGQLKGSSGEEGIMQLMPRFHLSTFAERTDPQIAIPYAANYLAKNFMKFGTWEEAIAAYNWGPTALDRSGLQAAPSATKEYIAWVRDRDYVEGFV